ncbi:condensation domain-containing protein [Streptomyces griseorubiginosus]|uniref:condensation domain-containing protein n=1 Tax=Streptomyces griseorubiginosus TaxID=67304 RepID=UPI0033C14810
MIPLSYAQRRLWFLNRLQGPSAAYNAPVVLRLDRVPDAGVLEAAVRDVVARHETLRTTLPAGPDGEPYQRIAPADAPVDFAVSECGAEGGDGVHAAVRAFVHEPFDITRDLPLRVRLFTGPGPHGSALVLLLHHVATDGWSVRPLLHDLSEAFAARSAGHGPAWEPLPVQYADYSLWQHDMLGDPLDPDSVAAEQLAHWKQALAGAPTVLDLPSDRPRPAEPSGRGATVTARLDRDTHRRLAAVARSRGASLFMAAQTALSVALGAAAGAQEVAVGTAVAGRPEEDLTDLVGFFVNTLVLRTDLSGAPSFTDLLTRVRDTDLAAYAHDDLPFDLLVEHLNPERSLAHHPFFQVMLTHQTASAEGDGPSLGGLPARVEPVELRTTKFDLTFFCAEMPSTDGQPGGLDVWLQYATDLFEEQTARLLLDLFVRTLTALADDPAAPAAAPLRPQEQRALRELPARTGSVPVGPAATGTAGPTGKADPADPRVEILSGLFADLLGRDRVAAHENFFRIGGHSLLGVRLTHRIRTVLGASLTIRDLFLAPTPHALAQRLAGPDDSTLPPLTPYRPRPAVLPLSHAQRRLWLVDQLQGSGPAYNVPVVLSLHRPLDPDALHAALRDVVTRHEILRTTYSATGGRPRQIVHPDAAVPHRHVRTTTADVPELIRQDTRHTFDLATQPPLLSRLYTDDEGRQTLTLVLHHIAADGWSLDRLLDDLDTAYRARAEGRAPAWEPLPVQYADYALWQSEVLGDSSDPDSPLSRETAHWKKELDGAPHLLDLPTDRSRPARPTHRGALARLALGPSAHEALIRVSTQNDATLFMTLHALLAVTLTRLGAGHDLPIGTVTAGRADPSLDRLVGFFVNTLVLRTRTDGDPTFRELLNRVRTTDLTAYAHDTLPFDLLVEHLNPHRTTSHHPLTQVVLQLHPAPAAAGPRPLDGTPVPVDTGRAKFDLTLALHDRRDADGRPAGLDGVLEYATDLFDPATARVIVERFVSIAEEVAADPDRRVTDLGLTGPVTHESGPDGESGEGGERLPVPSLTDLFDARAAAAPNALTFPAGPDGAPVTRAELAARSLRLAERLRQRGVRPGALVGLRMAPGQPLAVAVLAVLRCRAGYVLGDAAVAREVGAHLVLTEADVVTDAAVPLPLDGVRPLGDLPDGDTGSVSSADVACVHHVTGPDGAPAPVCVTHRALAAAVARGEAGGAEPPVTSADFSLALWSRLLGDPAGAQDHAGHGSGPAPGDGPVRLLDSRLRPVPDGVPGEMYVPASGAVYGVPGRTHITAVTVVADPLGAPGATLLRTGRWARRGADGTLRLLGRPCERVRVAGLPVDTEAVRAALLARPDITDAVVTVRPGGSTVTAYVVGAPTALPEAAVDEAAVRTSLTGEVPDYAVPSAVVTLPALPRTPDGRVDLAALPAPEFASRPAESTGDDPRTEVLRGLFSEVLGGRPVAAGDNFFRVGGQSLLAVRLVNRVTSVLGVRLSLRDVFQAPTPARLAEHLRTAGPTEAAPPPLRRRARAGR